MKFTKPKSSDIEIEVKVLMDGESIWVRGCNNHPLNEAIKSTLKNNGWIVTQNRGDGYQVQGFTPEDRRVLRGELFTAYLKSPKKPETDNTQLISAIVKEIIIADCKRRNDDKPSFGPKFDAIEASQYDDSLKSYIEAAKAIIALF